MSKKTMSLHFIVDGEWLQDFARQRYWFEDAETHGIKILKEGLIGVSDEQVMNIINGDARLKGSSICDKPDCTQCVGLEQITYTNEPDLDFKMKIYERIIWLNKGYYKIGEQHISKNLVEEYADALIQKSAGFERNRNGLASEYDYDEYLMVLRKSFWTTNAFQYPSPKFMPQKGTMEYLFTEQIESFLEKVEKFIASELGYMTVSDFVQDFMKDYSVVETESSFTPKKFSRGTGSILVTVPDPRVGEKNSDKHTFTINMPIEYLLNYMQERKHGTRAFEMTQALALRMEKEKVLLRYKKLEENMTHAHTLLMNSMNLRHVRSGIYHDGMVEYYINGVIQWFVHNRHLDDDDGKLKDFPKKMILKANGKLVADGKIVEEYLDCR